MRFRSFGFRSFNIVSRFVFRASNLCNIWRNAAPTPKGCFLKAPSFGRGFFIRKTLKFRAPQSLESMVNERFMISSEASAGLQQNTDEIRFGFYQQWEKMQARKIGGQLSY